MLAKITLVSRLAFIVIYSRSVKSPEHEVFNLSEISAVLPQPVSPAIKNDSSKFIITSSIEFKNIVLGV